MVEMSFIEITYTERKSNSPKIAIVAVPADDGRLIPESAAIAKEKLEEHVGEKVNMLDYSYLGRNVTIIP